MKPILDIKEVSPLIFKFSETLVLDVPLLHYYVSAVIIHFTAYFYCRYKRAYYYTSSHRFFSVKLLLVAQKHMLLLTCKWNENEKDEVIIMFQ